MRAPRFCSPAQHLYQRTTTYVFKIDFAGALQVLLEFRELLVRLQVFEHVDVRAGILLDGIEVGTILRNLDNFIVHAVPAGRRKGIQRVLMAVRRAAGDGRVPSRN